MKRIVIITVGKTHSGKSTFARALEKQLENSLIIDQDNHAEFINTHYKALLPKAGLNTIKYAVTETIVDYAVSQTDFHLILCSANRSQKSRLALLAKFHSLGFTSVLVNFDIPDDVLEARVANTKRSTIIFRSAASFEEVLRRQQTESVIAPAKTEADFYFTISNNAEIPQVIGNIVALINS